MVRSGAASMTSRDHFRAHARYPVDLGATIRARIGGATTPVRLRDLSLGGAGFEVLDSRAAPSPTFEREAPMIIEIVLPSLWDPIALRGKIAWFRRGGADRPARVGLRFEHRDPATVHSLLRLLDA